MQGSFVFLFLFALIHRFGLVSALSQQLCTTKEGTKSVKPVPSTTYALTITLTKGVLITSTPSTTITPKPVTTTVSTTNVVTQTTTAPANTDTVTVTTTETIDTDTDTITATTTQTATATATATTTIAGTTTVPPPAGFTAITQEPGYVPKIKEREVLGLAARAAAPSQIVAKLKNGKSTVTVNAPAATSYAACSSANIAANANGGHTISEVDGGVGNSASFVSTGSSYDCCVACITSTDNCRAFV
ncbi:MAG: hypothetical protein Q9195_005240 [Heterodermia aff. obscurata]